MNLQEMQQCVRDYLFAPGSGYASGDWREMRSSGHFFINESSLRMPLHIVLYDDGERVEIEEHGAGGKTVISVANQDELRRFLAARVPTGARLEELRRAASISLEQRDRLESMRFARIRAADACVQPEDIARFAASISDSMRRNLDVITVSGRQSLARRTLYMLELALEAALPTPTEY